MTISQAIIQVLSSNQGMYTYKQVLELIDKEQLINWGSAQTPSIVSNILGNFIRQNDARIKRVKINKTYRYYFSKYENELELDLNKQQESTQSKLSSSSFKERDLHILLSSYLKNINIYSKTIFHEKSTNKKEDNKIWVHPDIVGVSFVDIKNKTTESLMKQVDMSNKFTLFSYEIKKEILSDSELKKCFFQCLSNSSWANFGYLVAFEISDNLLNEIERLNQSFGIGVINLKANPFESEIVQTARYKELDFKTIDKLCEVNSDFENFLGQINKILLADEEYLKGSIKELEGSCDEYFSSDSEIEEYCKKKKIPFDEKLISDY